MSESKHTARSIAATTIGRAATAFPELPPVPLDTGGLDPRDVPLALAIHRTTLQRWLTIEHILDRYAKTPLRKMEPAMQGVLLTGAAQLLFLGGSAAYAVVDESVELAKSLVRPQARGLTNAVLRKVAGLVGERSTEPWEPARDRLPVEHGTLVLNEPALPHPANLVKHLPAATSHAEPLIAHWIKEHGTEEAIRLCLHDLQTPPTVVVVEPGFDRGSDPERFAPHEDARCVVWRGPHSELVAFLEADRRRRVQDPASLAAGAVSEALKPRRVLDYCAGLGTKTRQLALAHPDAQIVATDVNDARRAELRALPERFGNVRVVEPDEVDAGRYDLVLLDVPCSNTGVLARRPEARYRWKPGALDELVALQRQIIDRVLPLLAAGGHVLYTSCSIETRENAEQAGHLVLRSGGRLVREGSIMPGGRDTSYHDASYHALVAV